MELSADFKLLGTASEGGNVPSTRSVSTTAPLTGGGDLSADRTLAIAKATGSVDGYLAATDWTAFNAKVATTRSISTSAPLTGGGDLSANRTLGIIQATGGTDGYLSAADWTDFDAKMSNVMTDLGDIIYGGAAGAPTRLGIGASGTVLHGGTTPSYSKVVESDLNLTNVTTANVTIAQHGLCPTLSNNAAQFLDGSGSWSVPAGAAVVAYTAVSGTGSSKNVVHNFGQYPAVQVFDSGTGVVLTPTSITHNSANDFTVVFSGSTNYTIVATIGSPGAQSYRATGVDTTVLTTDRIIKVTVSGVVVTMLTAVGITGREFIIDNGSDGDITVVPNGAETIEGEATQPVPSDSAIRMYSDGAGWRIY
jgi:hypothetical protein